MKDKFIQAGLFADGSAGGWWDPSEAIECIIPQGKMIMLDKSGNNNHILINEDENIKGIPVEFN